MKFFLFIRRAFTLTLFVSNLAIWGAFIFVVGLLKLLLPPLKNVIDAILVRMYIYWALINRLIMNVTNDIEWEVRCDKPLNPNSWYLIAANHRSWIDILVIAQYCANRIPMPRFFLKQELLYVPFLGLGCWALDMPFMKRYSQSYLRKNPHKRGADIKATKKACEKFKTKPTSLLNFVEGTRMTQEKHKKTKSPFKNLLKPKSGGIGFTLTAMGEYFEHFLDITILYPKNPGHIVADITAGQLKKVVIDIKCVELDENLVGDYFNDNQYKRNMQQWLNRTWQEKDDYITSYMASEKDNDEVTECSPSSNSG